MNEDEDAIETVQYHALYALYFLSNINLNKGLLNVDCCKFIPKYITSIHRTIDI